jgi:hypothetical protein
LVPSIVTVAERTAAVDLWTRVPLTSARGRARRAPSRRRPRPPALGRAARVRARDPGCAASIRDPGRALRPARGRRARGADTAPWGGHRPPGRGGDPRHRARATLGAPQAGDRPDRRRARSPGLRGAPPGTHGPSGQARCPDETWAGSHARLRRDQPGHRASTGGGARERNVRRLQADAARSRRLAHQAGRRRTRIRTISGAGELTATLRLSRARARLHSRPGDEFLATLRS